MLLLYDSMTTEMKRLEEFRCQFPLLESQVYGKPLVYFDNAATTQKPAKVIEASSHFYETQNANVHRASHAISAKATTAFEQSRTAVAQFINARSTKEVIWTSGTTNAINLVAQSWGKANLTKHDKVLVSVAEHHANIVPWQMIAKETGAEIVAINLTSSGVIDLEHLKRELSVNVKLISVNHISNVTGKLNPVEAIIKLAKEVGAKVLIDGAQAIAHHRIDVQKLGCDFYVFSGHKMFGPTGLGVLYGKQAILEAMPVYQTGGEMIKSVSFVEGTCFNELPFKFEPGTPNIASVVAFTDAITLIETHRDLIAKQDNELTRYTYQSLCQIKAVKPLFDGQPDIPLFSFSVDNQHNQDVAAYIDSKGIAIRAGHHCAMPLMEYLAIDGCLRVSLAPYNTKQEVDYLVSTLQELLSNEHSIEVIESTHQEGQALKIIERFNLANSWDKKHREIMMLGKEFTRMDKALRSAESLISGCESKAWLIAESTANGYEFSADSDAKIVRGLLAVTLAAYQGKSADDILAFDIESYFNKLGLQSHLSPSRGNGLLSIVEKIKSIAESKLLTQ